MEMLILCLPILPLLEIQVIRTVSSVQGRTRLWWSTLYLPKEPETILVTNKEAQTTTTTIYSEEGLLGNDPYEVFLGGNYGLLNIQTSSQSGRKLLLLKDSYANAIIGFLTPYFSEIDIIDPRYYSSDLDMQIAVNQYTDLLILYNLQSFAKDSSLALVLGEEAAE